MKPIHWWLLAAIGIIEISVSFRLVSLNPIAGWDENVYLMSARHLLGDTHLPYAHHRPPMFPMLIALFGKHYRMLPALAHIGAIAIFFLILKRLTSPAVAIGGALILMLSGDLRFFGMLLMTEAVSVCLLLLLVLLFIKHKPIAVGVVAALLAVTHWQMIVIAPAVFLSYATGRKWRACTTSAAGTLVTLLPFLIAAFAVYGNPLRPLLSNFTTNTVGHGLALPHPVANDLAYYWRELPKTHCPLAGGGIAALAWLIVRRRNRNDSARYDLLSLLLAMVILQLIPMHAIIPKDTRLLVPLLPLLLLATILLAQQLAERARWTRWIAWPVLTVSVLAVMPDRNLLWEINDRINDPVTQLCALEDAIASNAVDESVYTDFNDLAVMGHTGLATVAVTDGRTRHRNLYERAQSTRADIPTGALYLTWQPARAIVLASAHSDHNDTLYLVRWQEHDTTISSSSRRLYHSRGAPEVTPSFGNRLSWRPIHPKKRIGATIRN